MPTVPPHPCRNSISAKRCANLTFERYCAECAPDSKAEVNEKWEHYHVTKYDPQLHSQRWKNFRLMYLRGGHLICESDCVPRCIRAAEDLHHVLTQQQRAARGLDIFDEIDPVSGEPLLQSLCKEHHRALGSRGGRG
jgi:hypothetical protein